MIHAHLLFAVILQESLGSTSRSFQLDCRRVWQGKKLSPNDAFFDRLLLILILTVTRIAPKR